MALHNPELGKRTAGKALPADLPVEDGQSGATRHRRRTVASGVPHGLLGDGGPRQWFAAALTYVLLAEWLIPFAMLEGLGSSEWLRPLLIAAALFLLADCLPLPSPLAFGCRLLISYATTWWLFRGDPDQGVLAFLPRMFRLLRSAGADALDGHWELLSPEVRILLFLLGWSMLISVVAAIVIQRQRGLWLTSGTLLYLFVMQLTLGLDTNADLMRAACAGLLLTSLLRLPALERKHGRKFSGTGRPLYWVAGGMALALLLVAGATLLSGPKERAVSPLSMNEWPWIAWSSDNRMMTIAASAIRSADAQWQAPATVGYSQDDSRLGGGVRESSRLAFIAQTDKLTYWRGEALSEYTGAGWKPAADGAYKLPLYDALPASIGSPGAPDGTSPSLNSKDGSPAGPAAAASAMSASGSNGGSGGSTSGRGAAGNTVRQRIEIRDPAAALPLFSGGYIALMTDIQDSNGVPVSSGKLLDDPQTGSVRLAEEGTDNGVSSYAFIAQVPAADPVALRQAKGDFPPSVLANDLQLPKELPAAVRKLAESVTQGQRNEYDKASAVADYLRTHYTYNLHEASMPSAGEDFVYHFLFEQRDGYCDHFSTAMAVMLRTIGIPARWVKGYAPAPAANVAASSGEDASYAYTERVSQNQAHSWVEVYFPGAGWIPFDPTPGYSVSTPPSGTGQGTGLDGNGAVRTAMAPLSGGASPWQAFKGALQGGGSGRTLLAAAKAGLHSAASLPSRLDRQPPQLTPRRLAGPAAAAAALAVSATALWLLRRRLWYWRLLAAAPASPRREGWLAYMDRAWRRIFRDYGPMHGGETLREYVEGLPRRGAVLRGGQIQALRAFAALYESVRYGGQRSRLSKRQVAEIWGRIFFPENPPE